MLFQLVGTLLISSGYDSVNFKWRDRLEKVADLRRMLNDENELILMPCCYDGFTARLVEGAGFNLTFMTGFGVSAIHGTPDAGVISAGEMASAASIVCGALRNIPCIGDGDTGHGNPINVKRTVQKYAQAGLSGIMIEDQLSPKRCGHTKGKIVVEREEAYQRIQAAVDARNEGSDMVILARTDARQTHSLEEAIERCKMFRKLGADWTFLEAPQSEEEMEIYCKERLKEIGFRVAAYPLTLLSASAKAMQASLQLIKEGKSTDSMILPFTDIQKL
eukprot:gene5422-10861_t